MTSLRKRTSPPDETREQRIDRLFHSIRRSIENGNTAVAMALLTQLEMECNPKIIAEMAKWLEGLYAEHERWNRDVEE